MDVSVKKHSALNPAAKFCRNEYPSPWKQTFALQEALLHNGQAEIRNTDQGSQSISDIITQELRQRNIRISMDGKGSWRYNVFVERIGAASNMKRSICMLMIL